MAVLKTVQNARNRIDTILLYAMIGLVALGALCIMSAVNSLSWSNAIVRTHLVALPLGLMAFGVGWSFNYQIFNEQWKWLYGFILMLLIACHFLAESCKCSSIGLEQYPFERTTS